MMNMICRWVITFVSLTLFLTWCFLNRHLVVFDYSPFADQIEIPLFVLVLGLAILGFIWGALMTWLSAAPVRIERRHLKKEVRELTRRLHLGESEAIANNPEVVIDGLLPGRKSWWRFK